MDMKVDKTLAVMCVLAFDQESNHNIDPILNTMLDQDFLVKVLSNKIEWANLPVTVDKTVLGIISICASGNPGLGQLILYDILAKYPNEKHIMFSHYANTFPMQHPVVYDDNGNTTPIGKEYEEKWDAQKIHDDSEKYKYIDNRVDTKEYWLAIYNKGDKENGNDSVGSN